MKFIPVFNVLLLPDVNIYFRREAYESLTGEEPKHKETLVLLPVKADEERDEMDADSFYPIGLQGIVTSTDTNGYVVVRTQSRVNVDSILLDEQHNIFAQISNRPEIGDMSAEAQKEHFEKLKEEVLAFVAQQEWGPMVRAYMMQWTSMGELASSLGGRMRISSAEKYDILAEDSIARRTHLLEQAVHEFLEIARISDEAQSSQEEDHQKLYREQAIKKQMQYLQNELDEMHPETETDVRKFEKKIEEAGMNETAKAEAKKVLNRIKQEGNNSPEYGMLYDYLDFVTGLEWQTPPQEQIDLDEAEAVLEEDHFGLKKVKNRILQQIAVMNLRRKQSGSILLFVGAPGTGKTSIGQSIAKALHRKYVRVSLGGVRDEAEIRGHRRTYIGAMPGRIMDGIHKCGVSNPVMVLDEVDKLSVSYNGDPASALLEVLDPEQNFTFTDHYMNVPYDLSNVMFICTANSVDTIPEPLLNRMEVIRFPGYTATDKFEITRRHLLPKAMEAMGITDADLEVEDGAIRRIISDFTMEGGVRSLKKRMDTLCRSAAVKLVRSQGAAEKAAEKAAVEGEAPEKAAVEGEAPAVPVMKGEDLTVPVKKGEKLVITAENVREYLDDKPIRHDHILEKKKPGIVTGLAWTAAGGEILFIETILTKGSGKVIITGQLGDVMKESVQIAVSLVKSMYPEQASLFEENDLHVHVPAGAVPKDGPSAGITITSALASLVSGRAVSPEIGMTGEISLRGSVMPIGGLPEKLMAAVRAGLTTILIPAENEEDLDEVADEIKEKLTILPVKRADEVLGIIGVKDKE